MQKHQFMRDGSLRSADNWQKGIPREAYMDSAFRHFMAWWACHRGEASRVHTTGIQAGAELEEALCGVLFNAMGYLHEVLGAVGIDKGVEEDPPGRVHAGQSTHLTHTAAQAVEDSDEDDPRVHAYSSRFARHYSSRFAREQANAASPPEQGIALDIETGRIVGYTERFRDA
jgi:hypothetical protein